MENASKALVIAAEVLIGVIVITLLAYTFQSYGGFSETVNKNIQTKNINEFNTKFENYHKRKDLTPQDVITIANLAKNYNNAQDRIVITVRLTGVEAKYTNIHLLTDEETYEFINRYSMEQNSYFECQQLNYNETTQRIDKIVLKKLT